MNCEETLILLDAYFDNELDLAKAIAIEEHLCTCSSCPFEYEQRVALRSRLRIRICAITPPPCCLSCRKHTT